MKRKKWKIMQSKKIIWIREQLKLGEAESIMEHGDDV